MTASLTTSPVSVSSGIPSFLYPPAAKKVPRIEDSDQQTLFTPPTDPICGLREDGEFHAAGELIQEDGRFVGFELRDGHP